MANKNIMLEIGDFLGFCDLNGVEAIQSASGSAVRRVYYSL